jgi:ankyrin repeat protein
MSRYTHREIARFLDIPETTVQGRLRTGKHRLKERIWKMTEDHLGHSAPSHNSRFAERIKRLVRPEDLTKDEEQIWAGGRGTDVWEMLTAAIAGDLPAIEKLVRKDPRLATCSNQYRTPLHFATQENHLEVVGFLLEHGADPTYRSGNFWHERPTAIAAERGYTQLQALLRDHLETAGIPDAESGERIAEVIRSRDEEAVAQLLDAEEHLLTAGDARGNLPIHWAVMIRSISMIDLMLVRGADINAMRPDGARPLDLSNGDYYHRGGRDVPPQALSTHEVLIGYLIARGADYDIAVAAKVGDTERVQALLEIDPGLANEVPAYSTYYSGLPLRNACMFRHRETVKALLENGADPNVPEPGIAPQGGSLHAASRQGDVEIARWLLEKGADPNADVESSGNCMSAAGNNAEMLALLASFGGEFPDHSDLSQIPDSALDAVYGPTRPLRHAVDTQDLRTLAERFDVEPELVSEVLRIALRNGGPDRIPVIKLCLDHDAAAARQIHANELIYCLHRCSDDTVSTEIIGWLLDAGMTPNDSDWLRVSSLHRLAIGSMKHGSDGREYRHHTEAMRLFVEAGADLNARDEEFHSTPLGWAARWGRPEAVKLLLERGAATNLPDDLPWATPLAWARQKGHTGIVSMLTEAGAI